MLRGGSWNNNPSNVRSANRNDNDPDNRNNNIGFRVLLCVSSNSARCCQKSGVRTDSRPEHWKLQACSCVVLAPVTHREHRYAARTVSPQRGRPKRLRPGRGW